MESLQQTKNCVGTARSAGVSTQFRVSRKLSQVFLQLDRNTEKSFLFPLLNSFLKTKKDKCIEFNYIYSNINLNLYPSCEK